MKPFRLSILFLITCLLMGTTLAKADDTSSTMLWKMLPNESLSALAAKFYPKSKTMQRIFIQKTQQLNQEAQVFADANVAYPTATQIVIPTLKSLSVSGSGTKKVKRSKKASTKKLQVSDNLLKEQDQLVEKKKALDVSLSQKSEGLEALENKLSELKKQLALSKNDAAE